MERRIGLRGRTDFSVVAQYGNQTIRCRGIEISATGIVLERRRRPVDEATPIFVPVELKLPERVRTIRAIARPVRWYGSLQAFRFLRMPDADRLTLAEHLDLLQLRGRALA